MIIKLLYIISVSLASYVFAQDVDENTFLPDMGVVIQSADKSSKLEPPLEKNRIVKLNNVTDKKESNFVSNRDAGEKFSANCVLMGNISEKKDTQGNVVFNGEIKNIGGRRADFVKMDFVFRKNWSGETRTLTTFIQGSYNTFDSGIVSDASLLPGALGKFELYVPQDFGSFIGYSYVIDWEEYQ